MILHGIILRIRPARVAKAYRSVWTDQGSPLLAVSLRQRQAFQRALAQQCAAPVEVALGMRYGNPSIASAMESLRKKAVQRLLVLPLYPQYSATTTAAVFDAVFDELKTWRWIPELRLVQHYHDEPAYIDALAKSVEAHWRQHDRAERLLLSFHGLPKRYLKAGDPYYCECRKTGRLLAEKLGLSDESWCLTFQSRFGREEWLKPYTDHVLRDLAKQGVRSVQVLCPGFSADCLETLEEIDGQNRELFLSRGGESFEYIPALNDQDIHMEALTNIVLRYASDWPLTADVWDETRRAAELSERTRRARHYGAEA
jgi:ferrochelatase